mmetsp:Transcript_10761/g.16509  ORF Transcript_10761/g.16509 Transcript_10761/m.16509 type:complete len:418 (-) Transcript_10761:543-1796(-)
MKKYGSERSMQFFLIIILSTCGHLLASSSSSVETFVTGPTRNIWSSVDSYHKCNKMIDVPDIPARIFQTNSKRIRMVIGSTNYHHMSGKSLFEMERECAISWNMTGNPDPSMFCGNEFLDSTVAFPNGTVVSLIHTEYPGNRYDNCPSNPASSLGYPTCWTVTIGLAISYDWGSTWQHIRKPPHHLVFAVPYPYESQNLAYGWGDPSNMILSPRDGYYYVAMWNRNTIGEQKSGICIARTRHLLDPTSWRGWDGSNFTSILHNSPYHRNNKYLTNYICEPIKNFSSECTIFGIVWSVYIEQFVATIGCGTPDKSKSFYISTSNDFIEWTDMQAVYGRDDMDEDVKKKVTSFNYPSLWDPRSPTLYHDRNYNTIGQKAYLLWTSLGHSVSSDGRNLWATPLQFEKRNNTVTKVATRVK